MRCEDYVYGLCGDADFLCHYDHRRNLLCSDRFCGDSLIVSCIMIGIITHISVMERTKEIGILRALGASKRNISQVFNAETFIIGCCAGLLGIGVSILALIPINSLIERFSGITGMTAQLPLTSALLLIALSIVITILGGLLPAKKAAKKDPGDRA